MFNSGQNSFESFYVNSSISQIRAFWRYTFLRLTRVSLADFPTSTLPNFRNEKLFPGTIEKWSNESGKCCVDGEIVGSWQGRNATVAKRWGTFTDSRSSNSRAAGRGEWHRGNFNRFKHRWNESWVRGPTGLRRRLKPKSSDRICALYLVEHNECICDLVKKKTIFIISTDKRYTNYRDSRKKSTWSD